MAIGYSDATARCCLCGRSLSDSAPAGGECQEPGCEAVICRTCFAVRGRKHCPQHTQAPRPGGECPAPGAPAADSDELWAFLRDARARELNFVARFQANTESRPAPPLPGAGPPVAVKDWRAICTTSDSAPQMKRLLPVPRAVSDVRTLCPVNLVCRYTFRKPALAVEARCCADMAALVQRTHAAPPLSLEALLRTLHGLASEATKSGIDIVAGLFSLTGWDEACAAHLAGDSAHPALVHPHVSSCLVGPALEEMRASPTDRRMQSCLPLFRGETLEEEAARCKPDMYNELLARDRVFVEPFAREHHFTPRAALLAAQDLARERENIDLVEIEDVGPSLKWRK